MECEDPVNSTSQPAPSEPVANAPNARAETQQDSSSFSIAVGLEEEMNSHVYLRPDDPGSIQPSPPPSPGPSAPSSSTGYDQYSAVPSHTDTPKSSIRFDDLRSTALIQKIDEQYQKAQRNMRGSESTAGEGPLNDSLEDLRVHSSKAFSTLFMASWSELFQSQQKYCTMRLETGLMVEAISWLQRQRSPRPTTTPPEPTLDPRDPHRRFDAINKKMDSEYDSASEDVDVRVRPQSSSAEIKAAAAQNSLRLHIGAPMDGELGVDYIFYRREDEKMKSCTIGVRMDPDGPTPNVPYRDYADLSDESVNYRSEFERSCRQMTMLWHQVLPYSSDARQLPHSSQTVDVNTHVAATARLPQALRMCDDDEVTLWFADPRQITTPKFAKLRKERWEPSFIRHLTGLIYRPKRAEQQRSLKLEIPAYIRTLTNSYSLERWGWESVECIRKAAILGIPALIEPGTTQLSLGILLSMLFMIIYASFHPYDAWQTHLLAQFCQMATLVTLLMELINRANLDTRLDTFGSDDDGRLFSTATYAFLLLLITGLCIVLTIPAYLLHLPATRYWAQSKFDAIKTVLHLDQPGAPCDLACVKESGSGKERALLRKAKTWMREAWGDGVGCEHRRIEKVCTLRKEIAKVGAPSIEKRGGADEVVWSDIAVPREGQPAGVCEPVIFSDVRGLIINRKRPAILVGLAELGLPWEAIFDILNSCSPNDLHTALLTNGKVVAEWYQDTIDFCDTEPRGLHMRQALLQRIRPHLEPILNSNAVLWEEALPALLSKSVIRHRDLLLMIERDALEHLGWIARRIKERYLQAMFHAEFAGQVADTSKSCVYSLRAAAGRTLKVLEEHAVRFNCLSDTGSGHARIRQCISSHLSSIAWADLAGILQTVPARQLIDADKRIGPFLNPRLELTDAQWSCLNTTLGKRLCLQAIVIARLRIVLAQGHAPKVSATRLRVMEPFVALHWKEIAARPVNGTELLGMQSLCDALIRGQKVLPPEEGFEFDDLSKDHYVRSHGRFFQPVYEEASGDLLITEIEGGWDEYLVRALEQAALLDLSHAISFEPAHFDAPTDAEEANSLKEALGCLLLLRDSLLNKLREKLEIVLWDVFHVSWQDEVLPVLTSCPPIRLRVLIFKLILHDRAFDRHELRTHSSDTLLQALMEDVVICAISADRARVSGIKGAAPVRPLLLHTSAPEVAWESVQPTPRVLISRKLMADWLLPLRARGHWLRTEEGQQALEGLGELEQMRELVQMTSRSEAEKRFMYLLQQAKRTPLENVERADESLDWFVEGNATNSMDATDADSVDATVSDSEEISAGKINAQAATLWYLAQVRVHVEPVLRRHLMEWEELRPVLKRVVTRSEAAAESVPSLCHVPTAKQLFDSIDVDEPAGHRPLLMLLQCCALPLISKELCAWMEHHSVFLPGVQSFRTNLAPDQHKLKELASLCFSLISEEADRSVEYLIPVLRDLLSSDAPAPGTSILFVTLGLAFDGKAMDHGRGHDLRTARGMRGHLRRKLIDLLRVRHELACELHDPPLRWEPDVRPVLDVCTSKKLEVLLRYRRDEFLAALPEEVIYLPLEELEEPEQSVQPEEPEPEQPEEPEEPGREVDLEAMRAYMRMAMHRERCTVHGRLHALLDRANLLTVYELEWGDAELEWRSSATLLPVVRQLEAAFKSERSEIREIFCEGERGPVPQSVKELLRLTSPGEDASKLRRLLAAKIVLLANERIGRYVASDVWHGLLREDVTSLTSLVQYFNDPEWLLQDGLADAQQLWKRPVQLPV